jgi:hypothetical protein
MQSATADLVAFDPENESGSSNPPVPTYAEIELFPPTSGFAAKLGELETMNIANVITPAAKRSSPAFI